MNNNKKTTRKTLWTVFATKASKKRTKKQAVDLRITKSCLSNKTSERIKRTLISDKVAMALDLFPSRTAANSRLAPPTCLSRTARLFRPCNVAAWWNSSSCNRIPRPSITVHNSSSPITSSVVMSATVIQQAHLHLIATAIVFWQITQRESWPSIIIIAGIPERWETTITTSSGLNRRAAAVPPLTSMFTS